MGADAKEGADRTHMEMDADDKASLETAIGEAAQHDGKVIVVFNTSGPVAFSEYANRVSAAVCCFFPGMQGGKVVVDILFGLVNPSGKLPLTWPKHYYDCPTYKNFPGENKTVSYGEGLYVGYRYYDAKHITPQYPFGHGLSYTIFTISDLSAPDEVNLDEQSLSVSVCVKNIGEIAGSEIVQLYLHDVESKFDKPTKVLKGFFKVFLQPGEARAVAIPLTKESFSGYCLSKERFVTEPGAFDILIGTSATNIILNKRIMVRCKNPFGLTEESGIGQIAANPSAVQFINELIHANIMDVASVALSYAPDKTWREIWGGTAMKSLLQKQGLDQTEIDARYQKILNCFDAL